MDLSTNERLASVEAKLELLRELLKEIRDDVKNSPTRKEFDELHEEVEDLKQKTTSAMIKIGILSGALGLFSGFIANYLLKLIGM
jgi:predicted nuclease with TOPRIM domain